MFKYKKIYIKYLCSVEKNAKSAKCLTLDGVKDSSVVYYDPFTKYIIL